MNCDLAKSAHILLPGGSGARKAWECPDGSGSSFPATIDVKVELHYQAGEVSPWIAKWVHPRRRPGQRWSRAYPPTCPGARGTRDREGARGEASRRASHRDGHPREILAASVFTARANSARCRASSLRSREMVRVRARGRVVAAGPNRALVDGPTLLVRVEPSRQPLLNLVSSAVAVRRTTYVRIADTRRKRARQPADSCRTPGVSNSPYGGPRTCELLTPAGSGSSDRSAG